MWAIGRQQIATIVMASCLFVPPVAGQSQADEVELKTHFEQAGFHFIGQMPGLRPTCDPVHTADATLIAGISSLNIPGPTINGLIWHLENGDLDFFTPPIIQGVEIHRSRWIKFALLSKQGEMVNTFRWYDSDNTPHRLTNLCSDNHAPIPIESGKGWTIRPIAINKNGHVIGGMSKGHTTHPLLWSTGNGFQGLEIPKNHNAQATAINDSGDIVGTIWGGKKRGAVWLAPGQPGRARRLVELDPPIAHDYSSALDINNSGQVLLSVSVLQIIEENGKKEVTSLGHQAYLWSHENGYTQLPSPVAKNIYPYAIDDEGRVLLQVRKHPQNDLKKPIYSYYLYRSGKYHLLPTYPGADRTDYRHMSDKGLIVGAARIFSTSTTQAEPDRFIGLAIELIEPANKDE